MCNSFVETSSVLFTIDTDSMKWWDEKSGTARNVCLLNLEISRNKQHQFKAWIIHDENYSQSSSGSQRDVDAKLQLLETANPRKVLKKLHGKCLQDSCEGND